MKPLDALVLPPLLVALGYAATQSIPGTRTVFEIPDRRPFIDVWITYAPRQSRAVAGQLATDYALESIQSEK